MSLFRGFNSEDSIHRERGWRQEDPSLTRNSSWKGVHKARGPSNGHNSGLHGAEPSMASLSTASVYLYHRKSESRVSPQTIGRGMRDQSSPSPPLVCQNHFRYPEAGEQVWVPCLQPQLTLTWHVVPRSPATLGFTSPAA